MTMPASNSWFAFSTMKDEYRLWNYDKRIELWNMDNFHGGESLLEILTLTRSKFCELDWILGLAVTPNERYLISCSCDRSICIADIEKKMLYHRIVDAHDGWFQYTLIKSTSPIAICLR